MNNHLFLSFDDYRLVARIVASLTIFSLLCAPLELVLAQEAVLESTSESVKGKNLVEISGDTITAENSLIDDSSDTTDIEALPFDTLSTTDVLEEKSEETTEKTVPDPVINELQTQSLSTFSLDEEIPSSTYKSKLTSQVDEHTGAFLYSIPITTPPGRNGLDPDISLTYSSQRVEDWGAVGHGWNTDIPYIQRLNKTGVEDLYTGSYFYSSLSHELATTSNATQYIAKVDDGSFLNYQFISNKWIVTDKEGNTYTFGSTAGARQDDPNDSSKVYKWMLEEVRDSNNNYIKYEYFKDSGQIYPSRIVYTGNGSQDGLFEVEFILEPISDALRSFETGFEVATNSRVVEIRSEINGSWNRKYTLTYTQGDGGNRSLLSSVTESGKDESGTITTLPSIKLEYIVPDINWGNTSINLPEYVYISDGSTYVVDINGDGLSDVIRSIDYTGDTYKDVYLNNGNGFTATTSWTIPVLFVDDNKDTGARLLDANSDGLVDIVFGSVYLNTGSAWVATSSITFPELIKENPYGMDAGTRIVDINGDGLQDVVRSFYYQNVGFVIDVNKVYLHNGNGWTYDPSWTMPELISNAGHDTGVRFIEINGDNLTDFIQSEESGVNKVYINTGSAWVLDASITVPAPLSRKKGVGFGDVNGDGITDIIRAEYIYIWSNPVPYWPYNEVYLGNGSGWTLNTSWAMPAPFVHNADSAGTALVDVNGDGIDDVVSAGFGSSGGVWSRNVIYFNNGKSKKADLLYQITSPEGGRITVEYKQTPLYKEGSGATKNPKLPFVLDTVAAVNYFDGISSTSTNSYTYEQGEYYYKNTFDKKLGGFGLVTKTDAEGNVTKVYYHQGNTTNSSGGEYNDHVSKIGKVYRKEVYDSNNKVYTQSINKWENVSRGGEANFVKKTQNLELSYDGGSNHKDKAITYIYDNSTGNLTTQTEWGQVTGSTDGTFSDTGSDKFITTLQYATNASSSALTLPSVETKVDQNGTKVKEIRYYYDLLPLGSFTKGNTTKEEYWKNGTTYIDVEKTYNSYGLVTQEKDPRDKMTTYSYDQYNLYVATSTNSFSHVTTYTYDYSLGKPKLIKNPHGNMYETIYDGLDRVIAETIPDPGSQSNVVKTEYLYTINTSTPSSIRKTDYLTSATSTLSYIYFDGLGRKIQTRIEAEGSNYAVQSTVYDAQGLVHKESVPYFDPGSSYTSPSTNTNLYTVYTYDTLQRTKNATTPMGVTNYAYDLWKTTETDSKGNSKDIHTDAYGNIVQVDEHNGANTYSTHYEWDGNKNLIKITDALGNVRNFTYDGLSRRLTVEDLHNTSDITFGVWSYVYDDSGNITQITDPKGQVVNRTYNAINQLIGENFTGTLGTEREFSYNSCSNGIGLLCIATTTDAVTKYKYNKNRLLSEETHIIDNISYVTTYDYDRQGNISSITYPDGAEVRFVYDNAGLLDSILIKEDRESLFSSVVTSINYSPHGKVKKEVFGNNVSSTYTYDGSKFYRLYKKVTTSDSQNIQDLTYIYDSVGNAIRITDDSGTTTRAISYAYDDLYRLLNSKLVGSPSQVLEEFTYNAIGNILSKSNGSGVVAYSYQGDIGISTANPHAPTTVGSSTLMYDNNGNMVSGLGYTNTWNYRNELTQTVKNGNTYSYGYDHAGNRVKFIRPSGTIVYPNKYYNIAGATSTKHIYALGKLIASVETVGSISNPYYIHTDHLGGTDVVTNSSGSKVEDIEYEVFGSLKSDVGTYKESRKYIGAEFDSETNLNYLGSRYQNGAIGKFISQDPVFLSVGNEQDIRDKTGLTLEQYLMDPQKHNSYSYAANNPIKNKDTNGEWLDTVVDVGFMAYDLYKMGSAAYAGDWEGVRNEAGNLALDAGGAFLPGVTGLGMVRRAGQAANMVDNVNDANRGYTRFIEGVKVDYFGKEIRGTVDLKPTLDRIQAGDKLPYRNDGTIFQNREGILPSKSEGYYKEYVHPTPGQIGAGSQRIIQGKGGEIYYSPDHYQSKPIRIDRRK